MRGTTPFGPSDDDTPDQDGYPANSANSDSMLAAPVGDPGSPNNEPMYEFRCPECGYDHVEAGSLATRSQNWCGLCAGDTGHDVRIDKWLPGEEPPS